MARLDNWVSPGVMHALGWALIHSLWQCLACAALAALLMTFSRRPSVRHVIGVGALALMLALPVATFLVLMRPAAPVQAVPAPQTVVVQPAKADDMISAAPTHSITVLEHRAMTAIAQAPRALPLAKILPWLVGAWLGGVLVFSLRFAGGFLLLARNSNRQSAPLPPHITALCLQLQDQIGLRRAIRYLESGWLQVPAVVGWLRPIVFLPACALTGLSEIQLRAVIAHELAHIRRFDPFLNLLQILAETLLFYHPALWWLNRRINSERELACDEIAVAVAGDRFAYARALTMVAEWARAPTLAMAVNRGSLSERILHILGQKPFSTRVRTLQSTLGLTGSMLFLAAAIGAANALFGIAYPIPAAQAKARVEAVLVSSQTVVDRAVHQLVPVIEPVAVSAPLIKDTAEAKPAPDQNLAAAEPAQPVAPPSDLPEPQAQSPAASQVAVADNTAAAPVQMKETTIVPVPTPGSEMTVAGEPGFDGTIVRQCVNQAPVYAQVVSSDVIRLPGFMCYGGAFGGAGAWGACKGMRVDRSHPAAAYRGCPLTVTMRVRLADPGDASKMQPGQIVTLAGDIIVATDPRTVPVTALGNNFRTRISYLVLTNAKIMAIEDAPAGLAEAQANDYWRGAQPATTHSSMAPGTWRCEFTNQYSNGRGPGGNIFEYVLSPSGAIMPGFNC